MRFGSSNLALEARQAARSVRADRAGIADAAGGDWSSRARVVLCEIYGSRPADDTCIGIQLLADVRLIFDEDQLEKMTTTDLLEKLSKVETSPWAEYNHGKPISAVGLSKLLKPFEVYPKNIRMATAVQKGVRAQSIRGGLGTVSPQSSYTPLSSRYSATSRYPCG